MDMISYAFHNSYFRCSIEIMETPLTIAIKNRENQNDIFFSEHRIYACWEL